MSFNNDEKCAYRVKYDDGSNIYIYIYIYILNIIFINNVKQLKKIMGWMLPPWIVVNNIIYVFCEKLGHLENK
jgi:hypothetical protein